MTAMTAPSASTLSIPSSPSFPLPQPNHHAHDLDKLELDSMAASIEVAANITIHDKDSSAVMTAIAPAAKTKTETAHSFTSSPAPADAANAANTMAKHSQPPHPRPLQPQSPQSQLRNHHHRMLKYLKISLDTVTFGCFLYLMSYHAGAGLLLHVYVGIGLVLLFLIHQGLNWNWYRTIFRGKYNARRTLLTIAAMLLLVAMIVMMVTSYKIASMALPFEFLPPPRHQWREMHVAVTSWCFLLMAGHLGIHLHASLQKWEQRCVLWGHGAKYGYYAFALLLLIAGALSCDYYQFGATLMMVPIRPVAFDPLTFYGGHLSMVAMVVIVMHVLLSLVSKSSKSKNKSKNKGEDGKILCPNQLQ